jgi:hypothetical protein
MLRLVRGKSGSTCHLFHVPLAPAAHTPTVSPSHRRFSVGRAVRVDLRCQEHEISRPLVGTRHRLQLQLFRTRHRRVRHAGPTRLTDSVRCYFRVAIRMHPQRR